MLTKRDFVRRYSAGEFGNASPTWDDWNSLNCEGNSCGRYHLRNRVAGGETHYNLDFFQIIHLWRTVTRPDDWYASAMCPHERNLLQGEVMESEQGLYLYCSTVVSKPMRNALAERAESIYGLQSLMMLRRCLCPNSIEWLFELLRRYPEHVVEFTALEVNWGTLPNFNTIFWEVRKY